MNPLTLYRRYRAIKRLEAVMKPNLGYARRRAAQLTGERRERFCKNVGLV